MGWFAINGGLGMGSVFRFLSAECYARVYPWLFLSVHVGTVVTFCYFNFRFPLYSSDAKDSVFVGKKASLVCVNAYPKGVVLKKCIFWHSGFSLVYVSCYQKAWANIPFSIAEGRKCKAALNLVYRRMP